MAIQDIELIGSPKRVNVKKAYVVKTHEVWVRIARYIRDMAIYCIELEVPHYCMMPGPSRVS